MHYVRHRIRRLPDTPEKIARGIFAGVFTVFTPFFGLHFVVAALLAKVMRGNIWAALAATFVGNPLTYVPIAVTSLKTGHLLLGTQFSPDDERSLMGKFMAAADDFWRNFRAIFTDVDANWNSLIQFWHEVYYPYLIGGLIPGVLAGWGAYFLSVPVLRAYQKRRRAKLLAILEMRRQAGEAARADDPGDAKREAGTTKHNNSGATA
ncbi:DUF2062 domain-containing protein [Aliiroseovarius sp. PTFE2010]|uniref:DUF2062 domain-containing protein n=1 Tax=Aliiroseovarius sp. PTFE2010 TaxID=3417190 RepID=UPI003CF2F459